MPRAGIVDEAMKERCMRLGCSEDRSDLAVLTSHSRYHRWRHYRPDELDGFTSSTFNVFHSNHAPTPSPATHTPHTPPPYIPANERFLTLLAKVSCKAWSARVHVIFAWVRSSFSAWPQERDAWFQWSLGVCGGVHEGGGVLQDSLAARNAGRWGGRWARHLDSGGCHSLGLIAACKSFHLKRGVGG